MKPPLKKLFTTLSGLTFTLAIAGGSHALIYNEGLNFFAERMAPEYVQLTSQQANAVQTEYTKIREEWKSEYITRCSEDRFAALNDWLKECLNNGKQRLSQPTHVATSEVYEIHAAEYRRTEIEPRIVSIRDTALPWIFGVIYAIIAISALCILTIWLSRNIFPRLKMQVKAVIEFAKVTNSRITGQNLDGVVREMTNVKALFDNGLITEEEFEERKSKLRKILGPLIR